MLVQNGSLIDSSDTLETSVKIEEAPSPKEEAPKVRTRRKAKPYEQLTQMGRLHEEKKAAQKAKRNTGKEPVKKALDTKKVKTLTGKGAKIKLNGKVPSKASSKKKDKPSKASDRLDASAHGVAHGGEKCRLCGKRLTRGTSITAGMGPECARQTKRLPAGVTMQDHWDGFKVVEAPKGYIKLQEAVKIARSKGVSGYSFMIAIGGNRMLRPPLNENFKIVVFKNTRYVPKASVSDKELAPLKKPSKRK